MATKARSKSVSKSRTTRTPKTAEKPTRGRTLGEALRERGILPPKAEEQPLPLGLVERAAERIGYNPAGFAPEEQAAIDQRRRGGLPVSEIGKALVMQLRTEGASTETVAHVLRREAHRLESLAELMTPTPEARDSMLKDALEIIEEAESIYCHDGDGANLLAEAIRAAKEDVELFEYASGNMSGGASEMAFIRAENRLSLALKLDAFRKKHSTWKPVRTENDSEQAKEGAA